PVHPVKESPASPSVSPCLRGESLVFDFSDFGGMLGAAEQCGGIGECRKRQAGTMCPSYRATRDEADSTRGRANALCLAISGQLDLHRRRLTPAFARPTFLERWKQSVHHGDTETRRKAREARLPPSSPQSVSVSPCLRGEDPGAEIRNPKSEIPRVALFVDTF